MRSVSSAHDKHCGGMGIVKGVFNRLKPVKRSIVLTKKRRLKCRRKDESDIRGTVLSTKASVRTSAFQQVF